MTQTLKVTTLSPSWTQWIHDNLERGCTADSLLEAMVQQNFDHAAAASFIRQSALVHPRAAAHMPLSSALHNTGQAAVPNTAYVYETPRLAQSGNLIRTPDRDVRVSLRLSKPVVAVFDDIFSPEECDELIRLARAKLKRSTIVDPGTGKEDVISGRSSTGTFFALLETEFIATLDRRISAVMNMPVDNGEGLQILNYQVGGEYKAHFDYFAPSDPGSAVHLAKGGQRVSTLVIYLNDVQEAGETTFPEVGLVITPKKGAAVYFEYCNSLNQVDPLTLHSGTPVVAGEKWIATKWVRQGRYG